MIVYHETGGAQVRPDGRLGCYDCGVAYGDFPDLVITHAAWKVISPTKDEGGLLCPTCIAIRLDRAGLQNVYSRFTSGALCMEF